ncbi:MAG: NAD-dependent epimerase/dehydratase family protein [Burkholderiales bacterium]|nr:NAD-dependent epimerase/dehydratase family protein [Burkholderiales bacterium]
MESGSSEGRTVLVLGARSQIGEYLLPALVQGGYRVLAATRGRFPTDAAGAVWVRVDSAGCVSPRSGPLWAVVNLAPIKLLPAMLQQFSAQGVSRLIAFSSTSVFTKVKSHDPHERELVRSLLEAERAIASHASETSLHWTVLRPTLVYSWGRDRNVSEIGRFVRRFRVFPLLGQGTGARQPVHAQDLADACLAALDNQATFGKAYNLAGARRLTYRRMVEEIFLFQGLTPRVVTLPGWLIRGCIQCARPIPRFRNLSPELATRMQTDMCFDSDAARVDFGFDPRPFALP